MKILSDPIVYAEIRHRGRANVREAIPPPELVLLRDDGESPCIITMNEAQLHQIIKDAVRVLENLRMCRVDVSRYAVDEGTKP